MNESRTKQSIRNVMFLVGSKCVQILMAFLVRTFLIKKIGVEILGLEGVFTSVITVLSLADLGLSSAIIYSLYEPLFKKDTDKIASLISFFQKLYCAIGGIILLMGVSLIPVLPHLINLPGEVENINIIYVLTVLGTSVSYLFAGGRIILEADQKKYRIVLVEAVCNIIVQILQVIIIFFFKSYILVLITKISYGLVSNLIIQYIGNKQYPYLLINKKEHLQSEEKKKLFGNMRVILCHNIGGVFVTGTDNMIISAFISTIVTGLYSNYLLIINSITTFVTLALNALIPSVGNLRVENNDTEHHYSVYEEIVLINFFVSSFCAVALHCLLNPFIVMWLGEEFLMEEGIVTILCMVFYISTMRYGIGVFCTAGGYFKETVMKPLLEGGINLVVSLALVKEIGLYGVFIGTLCSLLLGSVWIDPYVLYKKWFKIDFRKHLLVYIRMMFRFGLVGGIMTFICHWFTIPNAHVDFMVKLCVVCIFTIALLWSSMIKLPGYNSLCIRIKGICRK